MATFSRTVHHDYCHMQMADLLLSQGANATSPGPSRTHVSPLQAVIAGESIVNIVDRLLDMGADVNAHDAKHGTALTAAANRNPTIFVQRLLAHGADWRLAGAKSGYVYILYYFAF
jgi:ankyrin repeat protein